MAVGKYVLRHTLHPPSIKYSQLSQEQEIVERQEGPQEENPRSLHPQRLVLSQSSLHLQHSRVRLDRDNDKEKSIC